MSYACYLKKSQTTGNPEFWAYEEAGSHCNLMFGSMVSSGRQLTSKDAGYGTKNEARKRNSGYILGAVKCSVSDIDEAKKAVNGASYLLSSNAFSLYQKSMRILNRHVDLSLDPDRSDRLSSSPSVIAVKPVLTKEIKTITLIATSQDAVIDPWNW